MNRAWSSWVVVAFLALAGTRVAVGQEPNLPALERVSPEPVVGASAADELYRGSFAEIAQHYEHYRAQAFRYQWIDRSARLIILFASTAAALILALSESKRAKHAVIVLSMLVASTQAADQQFNLSEMREISWRTAVDLKRVLSEFREEWVLTGAASGDPSETHAMVRRYRERFNAAVEREMDVSLAPIPAAP